MSPGVEGGHCVSSLRNDVTGARLAEDQANRGRPVAAEQLQREVARLRLLVETITDVVSTATNTGVITWVSDSITPTLGWRPDEVVGHLLVDFVHPEDHQRLVDGGPDLQQGRATRAEIRVRTASGGFRWINILRRQILDETGAPTYRVAGWRDVTEEIAVREALAASHGFVRALLDAMLEPFVLLQAVRDHDGQIVDFAFSDANPAALDVYGMARGQLLGQHLTTLHPSSKQTGLFDMYVDVVDRGVPLVLDAWRYPSDMVGGPEFRSDVRGVRVGDAVMQVWRDVTSRFEVAQRLERLALHDGLTGALNHGEALHRLDAMLTNSRVPGDHLAVLFCDTDMFKDINDTHGHAAGDQVLVELTRRIEGAVRREDLVARMGGDEFLVILTGVHDAGEAAAIAEKVRAAVAAPISLPTAEVATSLSIGVTLARPGDNMDRLLERADMAMYAAKREGRDRVATL